MGGEGALKTMQRRRNLVLREKIEAITYLHTGIPKRIETQEQGCDRQRESCGKLLGLSF